MNKKIVFQKIGGILTEINEQYQYLSGNMENINDLELELFVANANFLTEHAIILKKINETQLPVKEAAASESVEQKEIQSAPPVLETTSPLISPVPIREPEPAPVFPVQDKIEVQVPVSPAPVYVEPASAVKPIEVVSEPILKSVPEFIAAAEPVADSQSQPAQSNPAPTLNDILSGKNSQNTISRQYHGQSFDLKTMVNLNDKLLFVKDLFNGYSLAYSEAIELANRCDSFEAAVSFLQANYAEKNKWAEKQNTADKLYDILNRRFSK